MPSWNLTPSITLPSWRIDTRASAHVGRHQRGPERLHRSRAAARLRHLSLHRADPGQNPPFGMMTVAYHPSPTVRQLLFLERRQKLLELRRHRRLDQPPRAGAKKVREGVGNLRWRRQRNHIIVAHVRCTPLAETVKSQTRFQQRHAARSTHPYTRFDHSSRSPRLSLLERRDGRGPRRSRPPTPRMYWRQIRVAGSAFHLLHGCTSRGARVLAHCFPLGVWLAVQPCCKAAAAGRTGAGQAAHVRIPHKARQCVQGGGRRVLSFAQSAR